MIDLNFGVIEFNDRLSLNARTPLSTVEKILGVKPAPSVPGRIQLNIGTHGTEGKTWGVGVVFVQSKLIQVWLQYLDAENVDSTVWSLENEKLRKSAHDVVLRKLCSSSDNVEQSASSLSYKFPWGKVSSLLDVRGVQALILVEYF